MKILGEFLRFGLVGTAGFLVDVAILYLGAPLLGWHAARVVSFFAAATSTWELNRHFTFQDAASKAVGVSTWHQYFRYLVAMLGGGVFNYLAYAATIHFAPGAGAPALGVAIGSIAGLFVNFLSARFLVFRSSSKPLHKE
jgi:putative flippase GtrA